MKHYPGRTYTDTELNSPPWQISAEPLREGALFSRETRGSVGYDVCYCPTMEYRKHIAQAHSGNPTMMVHGPQSPTLIPLGIRLKMPEGVEAQIRPRSSSSIKLGIHVQFGTVDSDYQGELHAIAWSIYGAAVEIAAGTRVAQVVFNQPIILNEKYYPPTDRYRGEGGFGSTGV